MRVLCFSSIKGGSGRSTLSVGLARALARKGDRVLLVDLDDGVHTLDILLSVDDRALFGLSDLTSGAQVQVQKALVDCEEGLWLCPAPDGPLPSAEAVKAAVFEAARSVKADFLILDAPARGRGARIARDLSRECLILSAFDDVSLLAAEKTALQLFREGKQTRLVLNRAPSDVCAQTRAALQIDRTHARLLGVVPDGLGEAGCCFDNMAARLKGEEVPLFYGMKDAEKRRRLL